MTFLELVHAFEELESIASRNEMVKKLAHLFGLLKPDEARCVSYILLGELHPPFIGTQFGIAQKMMIAACSQFLSLHENELKKEMQTIGDIGQVMSQYSWSASGNGLSIRDVYDRLLELEKISGIGSQSEKIDALIRLFSQVTPQEAKYIARIIVAKLRLGFSDMTILDALSWHLSGSKKLRADLEAAYNVCTDLGMIVFVGLEEGIDGVNNIQIKVGVPIRPAAAERLNTAAEIIEKIGPCVAQPKLDGFRLQVHFDRKSGTIHFFSRHLTDMSAMFPDLAESIMHLDAQEFIVEGEAIGFNPETGGFLHFQETVKRRRKHGIAEAQSEYPLKLFLFDVLFKDGISYLTDPHEKRRSVLESLTKNLSDQSNILCIEERQVHSAKELESYFLQMIEEGLEGLVVKRPDAVYQAGKRNFNWIKLKRSHKGSELSDTIDVVIIGYYHGHGKRARFGIGALLAAVYNHKKDVFETIAKIGTGFSDEQFIETKQKLDAKKVDKQSNSVVCAKELFPDVWVYPDIVCEVYADEITRSPIHSAGKTATEYGYALRFPRFIKYRDDKGPAEATTVEEIVTMHKKLQG